MAVSVYPYKKLGKEFMPPLNEGDILFMPTAVPGMTVTEAIKILQIQDRMLREFPEVETVFGKAGQAETPTDPAPLSMFETVVRLKPPEQWRRGMTWEKLIAEMNEKMKTPAWRIFSGCRSRPGQKCSRPASAPFSASKFSGLTLARFRTWRCRLKRP